MRGPLERLDMLLVSEPRRIMSRQGRRAFLALIVVQAAHSIEEYVFRLFDVFAPARFVAGVVSTDLGVGFAVANAVVVLFGFWCYFARVRSGHPSGPVIAACWAVLECANGIGHIVLALTRGGYFPGVATAPVLLGVSAYLAFRLSTSSRL